MFTTIGTHEELEFLRGRGYEPLLEEGWIGMDHALRVSEQRALFGTGHTPAENERFYRWVWEHKEHYCEECLRPLKEYSAVYVSHILTRGANPDMAHDPRNCNILCARCHSAWENGERERMRIFARNTRMIERLRNEYYNKDTKQ